MEVEVPIHSVDIRGFEVEGSKRSFVFTLIQVSAGPASDFYKNVCIGCQLLDSAGSVSCTGAKFIHGIDQAGGTLVVDEAVATGFSNPTFEQLIPLALCGLKKTFNKFPLSSLITKPLVEIYQYTNPLFGQLD